MEIIIKKVSTNEQNVSLRTISYDVYVEGVYTATFNDICDAIDFKESL